MSQTLTRLLSILILMNLAGCGDSPETNPQTETTPLQTTPANPSQTEVIPPVQESRPRQAPAPPLPRWLSPNESELSEQGIIRLNSDRLILYSDLPAGEVTSLLPLANQFLRIVDEFLGSPPPNPVIDSRPIVGYLMADQEKFESLQLLPERIPAFHPGWHLDRAIWVQSQKRPYYQRHLLFHELVHAALNTRVPRGLPPWFEEGMAELLATHQLENDTIRWTGIPKSADELDGWGRIKEVRESLKRTPAPSLDEIGGWSGDKFAALESYGWSWAICFFQTRHPQHSETFHHWIESRLTTDQPLSPPWSDWTPEQKAEWELFVEELDYGLNLDTWAVNFSTPPSSSVSPSVESLQGFSIPSDRGWQSTGFNIKAEAMYSLTLEGEISLDKTTPDWTSTPSGISIHYASGQPIGRLIGRLLTTDPNGKMHFGPILPIGEFSTWKPPESGLLFLRINDRYADLVNNSGEYTATIVPQN